MINTPVIRQADRTGVRMGAHGRRRRLRLNNRRQLIARWRDPEREPKRAALLAVLRQREPLAEATYGAANELPGYEPPSGPDLRGLDLSGENMDGVDLSGARLQGANLARTSLRGANLAGADLRDTLLRHTNFTGADLHAARFDGAVLERTIFVDADLSGARISRSAIAVDTYLPVRISPPPPAPRFRAVPGGLDVTDPSRTGSGR